MEYVKLTLENYESIKLGYDTVIGRYEHTIKTLKEKNEKLENSKGKIFIERTVKKTVDFPPATVGTDITMSRHTETHLLNSTAPEELTKFFKENIEDMESLKKEHGQLAQENIELFGKIEVFKSTWIYKILNFFGVKI